MTNFQDLSQQIADAVETAAHSVVTVHAARPVSGTVVGPEQVLTAAHVLHADDLRVRTPDGGELTGTVVGRDPASDLALLRVPGLGAPSLAPGTGARVGELLLAVGRPPHGVQATLGLLERAAPDRGWLPSGAAPFRGVSGGALVDARGGLVGVLNAGVMRGTLLAVPAGRALRVADLLATAGRVPQGFLGIATQPVHLPDVGGGTGSPGRGPRGRWARGAGRGRAGLTVVQVEEGSPAGAAGLRVGDILLALGGEGIRHPRELLERVREWAGQTLTARVLRGGEELDVTLTVGER
ncbi:S1C family serine protease [Deinococcus budaensis]|uniref:S1-C subfamily serine protease n=1 Tax=Deinococcus budaensis TaxID=1665626 RepID=A0A7W8GDE7_9DEIO|nr:trypsin-like peptidase domain-containing protein [Deinococcus budaensis]MBB5233520.1 S1-C subfamily serine protease [Deinococcus budaensis]